MERAWLEIEITVDTVTREKQPNTISQRDHEKERPRFVMPHVQIFFNGGHQGRQNNTREKVQEEDPYEKKKGRHLRTKGGNWCFYLSNFLSPTLDSVVSQKFVS